MRYFLAFWGTLIWASISLAKTVQYEFDINLHTTNITGKPVQALAIGGSIPAPLIEADVGDILEVTFYNRLAVDSSVHWHGVLLPNEQDGVPYLTTTPIKAGGSHTFRFPITHSGTYWYHSHSGLQEQRGIYGPLVFRDKQPNTDYQREYVVVWSDWIDENPNQVLANLKRDGDYYALKKGSVQSWAGVLKHGKAGIKNRLNSAWIRMGPMDLSDIGYDAFLANGETQHHFKQAKPGERILVRMVNASASSYFDVRFANTEMEVVAADGLAVQNVKTKQLRMAIAETYDVIITMPESGSPELRASSFDGSGFASVYLGEGEKINTTSPRPPNPYLTDHSAHGTSSDTQGHHAHHNHGMMNKTKQVLGYEDLRSTTPSKLPETGYPTKLIPLTLTGNMERYVWSFNGKTLREADQLWVEKGHNVQLQLKNTTMMHHPIHLHGHFFRVLNGQGNYSPLKHTVDVPPLSTVTIEFHASEDKDWFMHCHNLYHMKTGMARVLSYKESSQMNKDILNKISSDPLYKWADLSVLNQMTYGELNLANSRHFLETEFKHDYEGSYELETALGRVVNRFFNYSIGLDSSKEEGKTETLATIGLHYTLPLLIESELRFDSDNRVLLGLSSELQLTDRTELAWYWDTDEEFHTELSYKINNQFSLVANYDSEFKGGVGITIRF